MRIGSLFAGIGGFDLAAESLGWSTAWVSEIDPFASAVLAKHFPHAPNLGDVTVIDWAQVEPVDVLCAGFPCQPHSLAGKRQASEDERDLWSECVRAIGILRPRYFVGENVSGLLTSESGRFFNRVVSDLAQMGLTVEWGTLSAAECGAPHQRSRIFIVAYPADDHGRRGERGEEAGVGPHRIGRRGLAGDGGFVGDPTRRGRGAGAGVEVRRADGGCDELGDADDTRREGYGRPVGVDVPEGRHAEGRHGTAPGVRVRLPDWSDAIPYRGADGTVRLIPRGALADAAESRCTGAGGCGEELPSGRGQCEPERSRGGVGDPSSGRCGGESRRGAGQEPADGHGELPGREAEGPRPEPSLRSLADGVSDRLAGRDYSLWPVTESEPGRVAKLRAIGNAVVPAWVVAGPFRRILELEAAAAECAA